MCDPVTIGVAAGGLLGGAVLGSAMAPKAPKAPKQPDPAVERAQAEAEAAQRANAQLAMDQRRRREGGSLIARGAPAPTFGDRQTSADDTSLSPISGTRLTSRTSVARQASSLISRGAPVVYGGGGSGLGGGSRGGRGTESMQ